jgi:hypothetical protein
MEYKIRIENVLDGFWGAEELRQGYSKNRKGKTEPEKDLIDLVNEDIIAFLHGAKWEVLEVEG